MVKEIYYCDRCGKEITDYPYSFKVYKERVFLVWDNIDCNYIKKEICKDCWDSLKKWIRGDDNADSD